MKKIKSILVIVLCTISFSMSAKDYTIKSIISEVSSVQNISKIYSDPFIIKYTNLLDTDLKISYIENKLIVSSKDSFDYIKINGQKLPEKASATFQFFNIKVKVVKKQGIVTIIRQ